MDRRGFFGRLAAVIVAGLGTPWWMRGVQPHTLAFHPKAFEMAMAPLTIQINPPIIERAVTGAGNEVFITSSGRGFVFGDKALRELAQALADDIDRDAAARVYRVARVKVVQG